MIELWEAITKGDERDQDDLAALSEVVRKGVEEVDSGQPAGGDPGHILTLAGQGWKVAKWAGQAHYQPA